MDVVPLCKKVHFERSGDKHPKGSLPRIPMKMMLFMDEEVILEETLPWMNHSLCKEA